MASPYREPALCQLYRHTFVPRKKKFGIFDICKARFSQTTCDEISRHFIYVEVQIQLKMQMQCICILQCNLQQSGRVLQGTKCTNNCPV